MTQQEFNELSKRYLEGNTSQEEDAFLKQWLDEQRETHLNMPKLQRNEIEKRMWQTIRKQIRLPSTVLLTRLAWISGMAACIIIGFIWFGSKTTSLSISSTIASDSYQEEVEIEVKNKTLSQQEVNLEDGTVVLLKQNSSLVYNKTFNQLKREVYLKGEAFFKVKKDVSKPFVVHTGELITEVLGTSFNIKQNTEINTIEVAVTTGRVSVYAEKSIQKEEKNGVILTPNQRVLFDVSSKNIVPSIVENPAIIISSEKAQSRLVFQATSLQMVLNSLSDLYGIEFMIANPKVKDCRITADLNGLSMFTQLELICKSIDATYEKRGTVVFINGDGCQ
ncbi:MAG: FecR family protein [Spirosomataceae bacterium]